MNLAVRSVSMSLADAVSGKAGLAGIRWLLFGSEPRDIVRRELRSLLSLPWMPGACHLRRAKFKVKPEVKLSAYYTVDLPGGGSGERDRAIAVMWKPKWKDGEVAGRWITPDAAEMEAEALRLGVAAPFHRLTARVPECGLFIQVAPLDVSYPQLVRISDPEYVRRMLTTHQGSDAAGSSYAVRFIKYQPGQRHLMRYDSAASGGGTVFAKVYNRGEGDRNFRIALQSADWISSHMEGATCLRPLVYLPEDDIVLYPLLIGTPLQESLQHGEERAGRDMELAGRALGMLHQAPDTVTGQCRPRSFEAEIKEVENKCDFVPMLLPSAGPVTNELIDQAQTLYAKLPQESPTFIHGDFKAEHLWVTPRGITLIDLDASRLADPGVDVGRFLADLSLWFDIWQESGFTKARERFLAGYATVAPRERLIRASLFEALELIRCTGRRLNFIDGDWPTRVGRLLYRAVDLLAGVQKEIVGPAKQRRNRQEQTLRKRSG